MKNQDHTPLKVISLGMGQQSVAMYLMSSTGALPRADYAIFADPGSESKATYAYRDWLVSWQKRNNWIPIIVTGKRTLHQDLIGGTNAGSPGRHASIPAFVRNPDGSSGILRRQCTKEYKVWPIEQAIRQLYGLAPGKRIPQTEIWMGISTEETSRISKPAHAWQRYIYPLCKRSSLWHEGVKETETGVLFNRSDCTRWIQEQGFPVPAKSACVFCPFQSDQRWKDMKQNRPLEWKKAVELDEYIRFCSSRLRGPMFLHRSCKPLSEVNFSENQFELFEYSCNSGFCGS